MRGSGRPCRLEHCGKGWFQLGQRVEAFVEGVGRADHQATLAA